ncbi:MAG: CBS domain-containing protein, partial [Sediminibacterium sp.]
MNLSNFIIHEKKSIFETLKKIEGNHKGFLLIHNSEDQIVGIVTDGDIRRKLLEDVKLEDPIIKCTNSDFIKASAITPRELLLKQLDNEIRFIPILDNNHKLLSIVTRDFFPETAEQKVFARSKSQVRISFGGGGSDVSTYFSENRAAVINATISLYTHSTLKIREDEKIYLNSLDLNESVKFENINQLLEYRGSFSLIQSVIKAIKPTFGFE